MAKIVKSFANAHGKDFPLRDLSFKGKEKGVLKRLFLCSFFLVVGFFVVSTAVAETITRKIIHPSAPSTAWEEIVFYEGDKEIARQWLDMNENVIKEEGQVPDGKVVSYYENGSLLSEIEYLNNRAQGEEKIYWEDGKLRGIIPHRDGKREGEQKVLYRDGQLKEVRTYKSGRENGSVKSFYSDGNIEVEATFIPGKGKNSVLHGERKYYYPNGNLKEEFFYKNGILAGEQKTYFEDGKIQSQAFWERGVLLWAKQYGAEGNLVKEEKGRNLQPGQQSLPIKKNEEGEILMILKSLGAAANRYMESQGTCPLTVDDLIIFAEVPYGPYDSRQPYENATKFCHQEKEGYFIQCDLGEEGYKFSAVPKPGLGKKVFEVYPGGMWLDQKACEEYNYCQKTSGVYTDPVVRKCEVDVSGSQCYFYHAHTSLGEKIHGEVKVFFPNGKIKWERQFREGVLIKEKKFDSKGNMVAEINLGI